jgi:hypothetical protein
LWGYCPREDPRRGLIVEPLFQRGAKERVIVEPLFLRGAKERVNCRATAPERGQGEGNCRATAPERGQGEIKCVSKALYIHIWTGEGGGMEGTGMKNAAVKRSHRQSGPRREDPLHTVIIWRCFLPPFPWLWGNDTAIWNGGGGGDQ